MAFHCSATHLLFTTFLLSFSFSICYSGDTLTVNEPIRDSKKQSLISTGEKFQLGFFTPEGSSHNRRYLGIWYYGITPKTVVWVANRGKPLLNKNGIFAVLDDGELELRDKNDGTRYWSSNHGTGEHSVKRNLRIMDSGNLVLSEENQQGNGSTKEPVWQSFLNPTDTFLPGMKMTEGMNLTSWLRPDDPEQGSFTFQLDTEEGENQYIIQKGELHAPYWKSQTLGNLFSFDEISPVTSFLLSNFSKRPARNKESSVYKGAKSWITFSKVSDYNNTRLVMSSNGQIQFLQWGDGASNWSVVRSEPSDPCHVLEACGEFSVCNSENAILCKCLPGFQPKYQSERDSKDTCERRLHQPCGDDDVKIKDFLNLKKVKVRKHGHKVDANNEENCRDKCLNECRCDAYSYADRTAICWTWLDGLDTIQEDAIGGLDINVRVALSDIGTYVLFTSLKNC